MDYFNLAKKITYAHPAAAEVKYWGRNEQGVIYGCTNVMHNEVSCEAAGLPIEKMCHGCSLVVSAERGVC